MHSYEKQLKMFERQPETTHSLKSAFRSISDLIIRIDDKLKDKKAFRNIFSTELIYFRDKLREKCESLMFDDILSYGRKCEDIIWRKVYYDVIILMKKYRRHIKPASSTETAYRTFLSSALCYYNHLLMKIQSEFAVDSAIVVDWLHFSTDVKPKQGLHEPKIIEWATSAYHRCLVCLGDIARYHLVFEDNFATLRLAKRFYHQAVAFSPTVGSPFNQLGTLVGNASHRIEAVYWYLRCIHSVHSFPGADSNLKRIFEKNRRLYIEIQHSCIPESYTHQQKRVYLVRQLCCQFIHLTSLFQDDKSNLHEVTELCQETLHDFNIILGEGFDDCPDEEMSYLNDDIVFKIIVICLITIHVARHTGSKHSAPAIAFFLAFFSHILNHTTLRLEKALAQHMLSHPNMMPPNEALFINDDQLDSQDITDTQCSNSSLSTPKECSKKSGPSHSFKLMRRRRRKGNDIEEDDDLSEGEKSLASSLSSDEDADIGFSGLDTESDSADSLTQSNEVSSFEMSTENSIKKAVEPLAKQEIQDLSQIMFSSADQRTRPSHTRSSSFQFASNFSTPKKHARNSSLQLFTKSSNGRGHRRCFSNAEFSATPNFAGDCTQSIEAKFPSEKSLNDEEELDDVVDDNSSVIEFDVIDGMRRLPAGPVIDIMSQVGLLSTVKVVTDWLKINRELVVTCALSSSTLWSRLCILLNRLPTIAHLEELVAEGVPNELRRAVASLRDVDWKQKIPILEDNALRAFIVLKEIHNTFDVSSRLYLSEQEQAIMRCCCLLNFGYSTDACLNIHFDASTQMFSCPDPSNQQTSSSPLVFLNDDNDKEPAAKKEQLMRNMAQLRLQSEVTKLESEVENYSSFTPFLVLDVQCFVDSLDIIHSLLRTNHFIVIISPTVIEALDRLKKDKHSAREAIKFLELKLSQRNSNIRSLQESEASKIQFDNKKRDKRIWSLGELINSAVYINKKHSKNLDDSLTTILFQTIPTGAKVQAMLNTAADNKISIDTINEFYIKTTSKA